MVFGSLWALRNSGGLIQNLTVTKKAANFTKKANLFLKSRKPAAPRRAMLISYADERRRSPCHPFGQWPCRASGGYGEVYGKALLEEGESHGLTLTGCIDPYPASCSYLGELRARHIPVYASLDAFYREQAADLLCISAPIHLHAEQTCQALAHGSHVLCEKPLCATLAEAGSMEEAPPRRRSGGGHRVSVRLQPGHPCFAGGHLAGDVRRAPAVQGHVPAASGQRLLPAGLGGPCPGGRPYRLRQRGQ